MKAKKSLGSSCSSANEEESKDRLSNLPEPLLHHIISFLNLKFVIQTTTLLSKTWQYLWTTLPYLNFHFPWCEYYYTDYEYYDDYSEWYMEESELFNTRNQKFMTNIFKFRQAYNIHTFHLHSNGFYNVDASYWILQALQRNVQNLLLVLVWRSLVSLPLTIITCKSLTSLTLVGDGCQFSDKYGCHFSSNFQLPDTMQLPFLSNLCLKSIQLNNKIVDKLVSACPILEKLVMYRCQLGENGIISISSLSLQYLRIYMIRYSEDSSEGSSDEDSDGSWSDEDSKESPGEIIKKGRDNYRVLISAPNLTSFECKDRNLDNYYLDNISSLINFEVQCAYLPHSISSSHSIDLPLLRNMCFRSVSACITNGIISKLILGCPLLEKLVLIDCKVIDMITISSRSLKHLVIDISDKSQGGRRDRRDHGISLSAPNLTYFKYRDTSLGDYHFDNLSSLREADIDVSPIITYNLFTKCLTHLCNVDSLVINSSFLQILTKSPQVLHKSPTAFYNLKSLKLSTLIFRDYIRVILYLLGNSSNLEYLFIQVLPTREKSVEEYFPAMVADSWGEIFSLQHLKSVEVQNVNGSARELGLLQIILKNAANLERMSIVTCRKRAFGKHTRLKLFRDKLMESPRASTKLESCPAPVVNGVDFISEPSGK